MIRFIFLSIVLFFSCGNPGNLDVVIDPGIGSSFVGKPILMIWGEYPPNIEIEYEVLVEYFDSRKEIQSFKLNDSRETLLEFERDFNFHDFSNEKPPTMITISNTSLPPNHAVIFLQYGRLEENEKFEYLIRSKIFRLNIFESFKIFYLEDRVLFVP